MIARLSDFEPSEPVAVPVKVVPVQRARPFGVLDLVEALSPHLRRASLCAEIDELYRALTCAMNQAAVTRKKDVADDCYIAAANAAFRLAESYMALLPAERRGEVE